MPPRLRRSYHPDAYAAPTNVNQKLSSDDIDNLNPTQAPRNSTAKMNKRLKITNQGEVDRLSSLPDELLHQILSFLGTRQAVQTSILSKRWRHVWKITPFLTFDWYDQLFPYTHSSIIKFMEHVLSNRNHEIHVSCFKLFAVYPFPPSFLTRLIRYPNEHNVKEVDVDLEFHRYQPFKLSTFSSDTTQKLKLRAPLDFGDSLKLDCEWVLPVLKTLHLVCPPHISDYKLTVSCLMCLPALTTLRLDGVKLPESLSSMCLPVLTSLSVKRCKLPEEVWDFPNLLSLELDDVRLPENMDDFFSALVSVRDVTLYFTKRFKHDFTICCPQLVHLKIGTRLISSSFDREIMVVAPKLYEFCCMGIFKVILDVDELESASIKVWDANQFNNATLRQKMLAYRPFINTLSKLRIAKILTLDSAMIEGLSAVLVYLTRVPSPFKNLKHVKLPRGCEESSISTALRKYLLGGNPGATFVTALPQVQV